MASRRYFRRLTGLDSSNRTRNDASACAGAWYQNVDVAGSTRCGIQGVTVSSKLEERRPQVSIKLVRRDETPTPIAPNLDKSHRITFRTQYPAHRTLDLDTSASYLSRICEQTHAHSPGMACSFNEHGPWDVDGTRRFSGSNSTAFRVSPEQKPGCVPCKFTQDADRARGWLSDDRRSRLAG